MKRSALIAGGIGLFFSFGAAAGISPICVPCLTVVFGLLAGYLAGTFDKPTDQNRSVRAGALSGLLGGVGMLLGQAIGAILNSVLIGPEGTARMLAQMGLFAGGPAQIAQLYWIVIILSTLFLAASDIVLMAGFGALGGLLWWKMSRSKPGIPKNATGGSE